MFFSINSTIELPIIIPSENIDIFLAASGVLMPNPTVIGILFFEIALILSILFLIG